MKVEQSRRALRTAFVASLWVAAVFVVCANAVGAETIEVAPLLKQIRAVGPKGEGHRDAIAAVERLSRAPVSQLPEILGGMDGAGPLATNWIRAAVDTIAQHHLAEGGDLPTASLETFLLDTSHAPRARRTAYELLLSVDSTARERLIPGMLDDESPELRRDAVEMALGGAKELSTKDNKVAAAAAYRKALSAARDVDQINLAADELEKLGQPVDLAEHFGFIVAWKLVGPFDNVDTKGFDVAYPPEERVDLNSTYEGKVGPVTWIDHTTSDRYGMVDLNKAIGKHMGAAGYAYAEFVSAEAREAELRLGCNNGNKVWLNGELLTANHVYHTNSGIDQYVGRGMLKKGRNEILVKICQNEQTEDWAQTWDFQLRVCDALGTAVLSQDRKTNRQ
jgi:hypothetical protein